MVCLCRRKFLCGPIPTENICSIARTYSWPWGGRAAEALLNAELSDSAISVPPSGFKRLRLKSKAISYEGKADRFQRFEIAPDRARVLGIIVGNVVDKLLKTSP
jgi:hypothetical protein